jgi:hypothetical protein
MVRMLQILLVAAAIVAAPALSPKEVAALQAARSAVAEMAKLATSPEEKKLAEQDRIFVERAIQLTERRAAARAALLAAQGGGSQSQLLAATKNMQETQMSFNLQYLQLQSQMQHENRSYTAISNIMKTKHDTVKNSINNVR